MRTDDEVLTYLEMLDHHDLIPARAHKTGEVSLVEQDRFSPEIRSVTLRIGKPHDWPSQGWDDDRWHQHLSEPHPRHWIVEVDGAAAGLVSLNVDPAGNTEVETFGLVPERVGGGLGGHTLTMVVRLAWTIDSTSRLWLHTSDYDHPTALPNYLRRGFHIYRP